ncbi:MAG: hypothetical protein H7276_22730, partial [Caulobacter sp.]|nr:hypothetical protein [Vitreoscilla sp.]
LRQLYGARFPGLYGWVLAKDGGVFGPRASDAGVQRWMEAFWSGDYVGRWLWSNAVHEPVLRHPTAGGVGHDPFGRADVYTGFNPTPPVEARLAGAREVEVCLGLGAHTHYLERDQATVAWMIDWLVRAPPVGGPQGPAGRHKPVTLDATAGAPAQQVGVEASVVSDGKAAPAAAPDAPAPAPPPAA